MATIFGLNIKLRNEHLPRAESFYQYGSINKLKFKAHINTQMKAKAKRRSSHYFKIIIANPPPPQLSLTTLTTGSTYRYYT